MGSIVRLLTVDDAESYVALRKRMLVDAAISFSSSPEDDLGSKLTIVRERLAKGPENVTFGAFAPELVGAVGILREGKLKLRHRLFVWGMYVSPDFRRHGIGRALIEAAIEHGRSLEGVVQIHLGVSADASAAQTLYASLGFRRWGTEPRSVCVDGEFHDEHHLVLEL